MLVNPHEAVFLEARYSSSGASPQAALRIFSYPSTYLFSEPFIRIHPMTCPIHSHNLSIERDRGPTARTSDYDFGRPTTSLYGIIESRHLFSPTPWLPHGQQNKIAKFSLDYHIQVYNLRFSPVYSTLVRFTIQPIERIGQV